MGYRPALLAAPVALMGVVLSVPGAAVAVAGGDPASADQPGCTFATGVTTCATTTQLPGTPATVTTPGSWTSATGPSYDFQYAANIPDCAATPQPRSSTTTTTTPTLVTVTTAHRGAPGSNGKDLGTTISTTSGTPVVTTTARTSPGTAQVTATAVTVRFVGLDPNTSYVTGARCRLDVAGAYVTSDAAGEAAATLDLSGLRGSTIQLELAPTAQGFHGLDYAVAAPFTVQ